MSNKKFFSSGIEQSAIDVIYKKKGYELLRGYKGKIPGSVMKSFPSYEQFILLLRTFYFSQKAKPYNIQVPQSLQNANSTFILYDNIKNHVSSCSSCLDHPDGLSNRCLVLKTILYPYGLYLSNDLHKTFYMHNGLDLRYLCQTCPHVFIDENNKQTEKREETTETINYESSLFLQEKNDLYKRGDKKLTLYGSTSTSKINRNLFI